MEDPAALNRDVRLRWPAPGDRRDKARPRRLPASGSGGPVAGAGLPGGPAAGIHCGRQLRTPRPNLHPLDDGGDDAHQPEGRAMISAPTT